MEADASNKRLLTDLGAWISAPPSWSPDGRWIVFVANHQLYIIRADGSSGPTTRADCNRVEWGQFTGVEAKREGSVNNERDKMDYDETNIDA